MCIYLYIYATWTVHSVTRLLLLTVPIAGRVSVVEGCQRVVAAAESSSESNIILMVETCLTALRPAGPFTPDSVWQPCTRGAQRHTEKSKYTVKPTVYHIRYLLHLF